MDRRHSLPPYLCTFVEQTPGTVLLEGCGSHHGNSNQHCWTRLFTSPYRVCTAHESSDIPSLFAAIEDAVAAGHTAAGFFTYECGACFEPTAAMERAPGVPLAWIALYDRSYPFDHETGKFVNGTPPQLDRFRKVAQSPTTADTNPRAAVNAEFALSPAEYTARIATIQEWIRSGDVYQLNFTAPWRVQSNESPAALYAALRARQPVDYGAFLHWQQGRHILSFSPELFFRVDEKEGVRRITSQPMKGTAPRGRTTAEDRSNSEWLSRDPKNRSENVMIVDLVRNDLGRLSRFGSVEVRDLFATQRFPTLWQMTSTVTGELRPEVGFAEIFRALFPCGSITGAPKVRAMQLIAEIETQPRGVYTGAIGFFSQRESIFNVAIRAIDLDKNNGAGSIGVMGTGSGIVIDSDAETEYREVMLKASFLTNSSKQKSEETSQQEKFFLIESLLWNGAYPFLEMHLDRLTDSADYFDIPCNREEARTALLAHAAKFAPADPPQNLRAPSLRVLPGARVGDSEARLAAMPRKVRLLLNSEGALEITDELLPPPAAAPRILRARVSQTHTDSADPMLFHKTTARPLYAEAFRQAFADGFDEVLFFNTQGELTEGAISNIFIEKEGRTYTPPIHCGLLAGVYRRHLLETQTGFGPEIEQRVLYEEDLRSADHVYLANAVRGLRPVTIDWES